MSKKYILGIDGGSQSTKIVIFDTDGNIICEGKESLKPMIYRKPGYVEHPDIIQFQRRFKRYNRSWPMYYKML